LLIIIPVTHILRILAWKPNSDACKKPELQLFLQTNNTDVAAICGTKLITTNRFSMPGFKVYRIDRNRFGEGVLVLVNSNLSHDSFPLPPMSGLETAAVCLQFRSGNTLVVVPAYLRPSSTLLPSDLDSTFSSQDAELLAGDLKCKLTIWNNASTNKNGNNLPSHSLNKAIANNYPNHHTHFPHNSSPSVLDIALATGAPSPNPSQSRRSRQTTIP